MNTTVSVLVSILWLAVTLYPAHPAGDESPADETQLLLGTPSNEQTPSPLPLHDT